MDDTRRDRAVAVDGLGQVAGIGQFLGHVDVDAALAVDHLGESGKIGKDVIIGFDLKVGCEHLGHGIEAAQFKDLVDFHFVHAGDINPQVAGEGNRADGLLVGVNGQKDDDIGAVTGIIGALVRTEEQDVGLAGRHGHSGCGWLAGLGCEGGVPLTAGRGAALPQGEVGLDDKEQSDDGDEEGDSCELKEGLVKFAGLAGALRVIGDRRRRAGGVGVRFVGAGCRPGHGGDGIAISGWGAPGVGGLISHSVWS